MADGLRTMPMGDRALLLEFGRLDEALAYAQTAARLPEVRDAVPGACTVLVKAAAGVDLERVRRALEALTVGTPVTTASEQVEIPTVYDGVDLPEVARRTGLEVAQVIRAHTATVWRVGFVGFAPGFAYLHDGDQRLQVPRRAEPRTRVPAGSVGLAGGYCGVYPRTSPGGWQLIGRTDVVLWDVQRRPPALLQPGGTVRFVDVSV
ncbi:MAG: allophanate hydrolase subunit 1 [Actinomycetota bacterium]|nr:allophanate hydrolase subunit 1 [Actinomycetota bacterium]